MDRRSFIGGLLAAAALARSPLAWAAAPRGSAKLPPRGLTPGVFSADDLLTQKLEDLSDLGAFRIFYTTTSKSPDQSNLVMINCAKGEVECAVPVALVKRHAIVLPPGKSPAFAFLPELEGTRASLVDLNKKQEVARIHPSSKGHEFSGHACFAADGASIFVPEFPRAEGEAPGVVLERGMPDLGVKRSLATGRYRPHNLLLDSAGKRLMVGHYGRSKSAGEPPSDGGVSVLDVASGHAAEVAGTENPYLALCHLERDASDNVFISTRSWAGKTQLMSPVLFGTMAGDKWESRLPEALKERFRFNFSLRYSASAGVLAVAHIEGKMVSFWDPRGRKLLGVAELNGETPLGLEVTPDGRHFLANTTAGSLLILDAKTRKLVRRASMLGIGFCPHISLIAAG